MSVVGLSPTPPSPTCSAGDTRYIVADPEQRGLYVRVMRQGAHVFVCVARNPFGKQIWATIGTTSDFTIDEAREKARAAIRRIKKGETPFPTPKLAPDSVERRLRGLVRTGRPQATLPHGQREGTRYPEVHPAVLQKPCLRRHPPFRCGRPIRSRRRSPRRIPGGLRAVGVAHYSYVGCQTGRRLPAAICQRHGACSDEGACPQTYPRRR